MIIATSNVMKKSAITEHLINPDCAKNYNECSFNILRKCTNWFDLMKLEAILIKIYKPKLCKQKDYNYTVSLYI